MKFGIDIGHNCFPDTGAPGIGGVTEDKLTKDVGTKLMAKLAAAGHTVVNCTPTSASTVNDSLRKRVDKANSNSVDVFVSIHFNSFNGNASGSEVFAISNTSQAIASSVLKEIVELGFFNRGVKDTAFFVIKNTSMPAILIECCFCDSKDDMKLFDAEKMAEAIKVGLIGESPSKGTAKPGILKITTKTVLKPSTEQASNLPSDEVFTIEVGNYQVVDSHYEERHYWVKFPDKVGTGAKARLEHFVFDEHGKVEE